MLSGIRSSGKSNQMAAATLSARRKKTMKASRRDGNTIANASNNGNSLSSMKRSKNYKVNATSRNSVNDAMQNNISTMTDEERSQLIMSMGENIDTRLQEIPNSELAELDKDAKEEMQQRLLEEVRLAAGTEQRLISSSMLDYINAYSNWLQVQHEKTKQEQQYQEHEQQSTKSQTEQILSQPYVKTQQLNGLPCVQVRHNCNSITAVASLGGELVVFGDKTGNVYVVNVTVPSLITHASLPTGVTDNINNNRINNNSDKNGSLVESFSFAGGNTRRKVHLQPTLPASVLSIAVSDTRFYRPSAREMFEKTTLDTSCVSYLAVGTNDGSIGIWETLTLKFKGLLTMHHGAVTGLAFRMNTATLYSVSTDKTLRIWSVPSMLCNDRLFGHERGINGLSALKREVAASVGEDGTMRLWKVDAATQQSYEYWLRYREEALLALEQRRSTILPPPPLSSSSSILSELKTNNGNNNNNNNNTVNSNAHSIQHTSLTSELLAQGRKDKTVVALEAVCMLTDTIIIVGGVDGTLLIFDINRRKPVITVPAAHGFGCIGDGTGLEQVHKLTGLQQQSSSLVSVVSPTYNVSTTKLAAHTIDSNTSNNQDLEITNSVLHSHLKITRKRNANPITALAAIPYTDIFASASYDGVIRLWRFTTKTDFRTSNNSSNNNNNNYDRKEMRNGDDVKNASTDSRDKEPFALLCELPVNGIVNSLAFAPTGTHLFVGLAKEPRRGRWIVQANALNSVLIVPLQITAAMKSGVKLLSRFRAASANTAIVASSTTDNDYTHTVEHVPAELYGFDDSKNEDENENENENNDGNVDGEESYERSCNSSSGDGDDAEENDTNDGLDDERKEPLSTLNYDSILVQDANGRLTFSDDVMQEIQRKNGSNNTERPNRTLGENKKKLRSKSKLKVLKKSKKENRNASVTATKDQSKYHPKKQEQQQVCIGNTNNLKKPMKKKNKINTLVKTKEKQSDVEKRKLEEEKKVL